MNQQEQKEDIIAALESALNNIKSGTIHRFEYNVDWSFAAPINKIYIEFSK